MVNGVEIGDDEVYITWYRCIGCGYEYIAEGDNYCGNCGEEIETLQGRCSHIYEDDETYLKCELPRDHKGYHQNEHSYDKMYKWE